MQAEPPREPAHRPGMISSTLEAARTWARSGVMALCGDPSGPPLLPPLGVPGRLDAVAAEIARLSGASGRSVSVRWDALLAGRAQILGFARRGNVSANGTCRLLRAADGEVALNLPREDDRSLVAALTGRPEAGENPWRAVSEMAATTPAAEFVARARLLGLAGATPVPDRTGRAPYTTACFSGSRPCRAGDGISVVDLSSLWAGPTAARVLDEWGARVIKVEDPSRTDGSRLQPSFYSWIHPATEICEQVEFGSATGRARLAELLDAADVVIESSRPRALEQLGLGPERRARPRGQVWLSITGHGRAGAGREWIGFGDDAAVAGGLVCRDGHGGAVFCGDAIADPIAGLVGALAVMRSLAEGGGHLIDVSLAGVGAWASSPLGTSSSPGTCTPEGGSAVERDGEHWVLVAGDVRERVAELPATLDWIQGTTTLPAITVATTGG